MSNFAINLKKQTLILETYEWDNVWWQNAPDKTSIQLLLLAILYPIDTRNIMNEWQMLIINIDGFGTSKALDNLTLSTRFIL